MIGWDYLVVPVSVYILISLTGTISFFLEDKYSSDADYWRDGKKFITWGDIFVALAKGLVWPVFVLIYLIRRGKEKWNNRNKSVPLSHRIVVKLLGEK